MYQLNTSGMINKVAIVGNIKIRNSELINKYRYQYCCMFGKDKCKFKELDPTGSPEPRKAMPIIHFNIF
jgi:hypothetical protein